VTASIPTHQSESPEILETPQSISAREPIVRKLDFLLLAPVPFLNLIFEALFLISETNAAAVWLGVIGAYACGPQSVNNTNRSTDWLTGSLSFERIQQIKVERAVAVSWIMPYVDSEKCGSGHRKACAEIEGPTPSLAKSHTQAI